MLSYPGDRVVASYGKSLAWTYVIVFFTNPGFIAIVSDVLLDLFSNAPDNLWYWMTYRSSYNLQVLCRKKCLLTLIKPLLCKIWYENRMRPNENVPTWPSMARVISVWGKYSTLDNFTSLPCWSRFLWQQSAGMSPILIDILHFGGWLAGFSEVHYL